MVGTERDVGGAAEAKSGGGGQGADDAQAWLAAFYVEMHSENAQSFIGLNFHRSFLRC